MNSHAKRTIAETQGSQSPEAANGAPPCNRVLTFMATPDLTLGEVVSMYVADRCAATRSGSTRVTLRSRAKVLLAKQVDGKRLSDLPAHALPRTLCQALVLAGSSTPRTTNEQVRLISTALRWARFAGLWEGAEPPVRYLKEPTGHRALSEQTIKAVIHGLDVAEAVCPALGEWVDFSRIALGVGLRVGDLCSIQLADVDQRKRWIVCRQKGDRDLEVPYPRAMDDAFGRQVDRARGGGWRYLWAGHKAGHHKDPCVAMKPTTPSWRWKHNIKPLLADLRAARERAGLSVEGLAEKIGKSPADVRRAELEGIELIDRRGRPITLGHFRACNITAKIRRGASLRLAGASVGHESDKVTAVYVGPLFEALPQVAGLMNELFETPQAQAPSADPSVVMARNFKRAVAAAVARGESRKKIAKRLGITTRTLLDWEISFSNLDKAHKAADVLETTLADLLEGVR